MSEVDQPAQEVVTRIRIFSHHEQDCLQAMKYFPGRFDNLSHYTRCALECYRRQLQRERSDILFQQSKKKKKVT